jgi:hypothetical protein
MKKIFLYSFLSFFFFQNLLAEQKESSNLLKNNEELRSEFILKGIQNDYTTCYAFYTIVAEGFRRDEKKLVFVDGLKKNADTCLKNAYEIGELLNLELDVMQYKVENEISKQSNEMSNRYINLHKLIKKHENVCKNLMENKKVRVNYWEKLSTKKIK